MDTETPNLSGANYRETFAYLCSQLPPPPDGTPAEASAERERRAMDAVVALTPMDAFEARLAARIVAMDDHAAELAPPRRSPPRRRHGDTPLPRPGRLDGASVGLCVAFPAAHPGHPRKAGGRDAPGGTRACRLLVPRHLGARTPPPPAAVEPEPAPADTAAEARRYAVIYPDRAARIRAAGGLPADLDFGPPEPALVAALLKGENDVSSRATLAQNSKQ